jgi:hypothetical protein
VSLLLSPSSVSSVDAIGVIGYWQQFTDGAIIIIVSILG